MPEQMSADFEQVMAQCSRGCFTGLLRVRTREGNGEVRFLSGIQDGVRFDTMEGDAALERLLAASDPEFEAVSSLPPIAGSTEPVPPEGGLHRLHAAQLMRYCESNSLTCALELEVEGRVLTARYRLGELLSIEPDSEHTSRLAEAKEGLYRFRLPRFELPANVQQRRSVPAAAPKAAPAPAPVAAAKPVAKPSPAPMKSPPSSLAETPLVAMKPVAIVSPPASSASRAPVKAPPPAAPKATPAPSVGAARSAETRPAPAAARASVPSTPPAARSARGDDPRAIPSSAGQQSRAIEARASSTAPTSAPPPVAARPAVPRSPLPPAQPAARQAPPSPVPVAPSSTGPSSSEKPALEGLWKDAVKPPPQSAPLELDGTLRPKPAPVAAHMPTGRAEGLSSIAYTPTEVPTVPSQRPRSMAIYWLLAVMVLVALAVAGWFVFGR